MSTWQERYPRTFDIGTGGTGTGTGTGGTGAGAAAFELRVMTAQYESAVVEFARAIPTHDLLFLRRDIRDPRVVAAWLRQIEAGDIQSLLALRHGEIVGYSAIARDPHSFSPHVGDLRVILAPSAREQGIGRVLIQESFLVSIELYIEKLTVQMTADQQAAVG